MKREKKEESVTVKGRIQKPLLSATPVRAIPKSTPSEKPPLHSDSLFLLSAFGGSSSKVNVAFTIPLKFLELWVAQGLTIDGFLVRFEGEQEWRSSTGCSNCCVHMRERERERKDK